MDMQILEPGKDANLGSEILIWGESPSSLVNLMGEAAAEKLMAARLAMPHLFEHYDEQSLYRAMRAEGRMPTATDNRLRLRLWMEYDFCQTYGRDKIDLARVAAGICDIQTFTRRYLRDPQKVAWLLCPPTGYMAKAHEALEFGLEQLRDILEQPHFANGKLDSRLADIKVKIVAMLEQRVLGAVATKNVHLNLNHNANRNDVAKFGQKETMESLTLQLKQLRVENDILANGGLTPGRPIIDAEEGIIDATEGPREAGLDEGNRGAVGTDSPE
jgi:hypothetical protein